MNKVNEFDNIDTCTDNYVSQKERMGEISIADLCRAVDLINAMNNMINTNNEMQDDERHDDVEDILQPLCAAMIDLRVDKKCLHCGRDLYKSDLPQYDFVCPHCDENF